LSKKKFALTTNADFKEGSLPPDVLVLEKKTDEGVLYLIVESQRDLRFDLVPGVVTVEPL
jgi:hypothetical protein